MKTCQAAKGRTLGAYPAAIAALACLALGAAPATADVKAGADAWARGDYPAAVREWEGPAAQGDPDALFNLGQAYRLGRGVPADLARAEQLLAKAAAQGHVQAADTYGLLLFDRGNRTQAMPYVGAAADRGDPRAQYLLGIAHFNGDLAPRDWRRAYALMTLARDAGLPQAGPALAQMDTHVPLAERQSAATLAAELARQAQVRRASSLAAADLSPWPTPMPPAQRASAATAGANHARPSTSPAPAARTAAKASPAPAPSSAAPWRIQLGAFGKSANADSLWAKVRQRPELAGHPRINVPTGKVRKLQAGGFASLNAAKAACAALERAGFSCLPTQD